VAFASYSGRRLLQAIPLLVGVVVLNFVLIRLAPGDPAMVLAGEAGGTTEEILREIRAQYGLDRPVPVQLGVYVGKLLTGDFGHSYFYHEPVLALILDRIPATVLLVTTSLVLAWALGLLLGVLASLAPRSAFGNAIAVFSLFGYAMPVFWTGIMLLIFFSVWVPWFPSHGMATIGFDGTLLERSLDVAHHLVLPAVTLGIIYVAVYSRLVRASMLEVLGADFVRTARAKGTAERSVVLRHALRNALLPVVTVAGIQLGQVLAGAILVETVFGWPGMGRLALESILRRDYPLLLGILVLSSTIVILANLVTDLCYAWLDPRIRLR
jgi:peptide/nickel transport system permease protein